VSPRVKPKPKRTADDVLFAAADRVARGELAEVRLERLLAQADRGRSELAEFRSKAANGERTHAASPDEAWWKYLLTPPVPSPLGGVDYGLDREEHRVLSKASSAAGGYLVPTSMDDQITAARRARAVIGAVSREIVTSDGTQMLFPSATAHGVATWTAENVAYTASESNSRPALPRWKGNDAKMSAHCAEGRREAFQDALRLLTLQPLYVGVLALVVPAAAESCRRNPYPGFDDDGPHESRAPSSICRDQRLWPQNVADFERVPPVVVRTIARKPQASEIRWHDINLNAAC
jgi:hypothetical protein